MKSDQLQHYFVVFKDMDSGEWAVDSEATLLRFNGDSTWNETRTRWEEGDDEEYRAAEDELDSLLTRNV